MVTRLFNAEFYQHELDGSSKYKGSNKSEKKSHHALSTFYTEFEVRLQQNKLLAFEFLILIFQQRMQNFISMNLIALLKVREKVITKVEGNLGAP